MSYLTLGGTLTLGGDLTLGLLATPTTVPTIPEFGGSIIGPIVSAMNVERAAIQTLSTWIETYLSAVEKQNGLNFQTIPRPPSMDVPIWSADLIVSEAPQSIVGGTTEDGSLAGDLQVSDETMPLLIATAAPTGTPILTGSGPVGQRFLLTVSVILQGQDETQARWLGQLYGAAVYALLTQSLQLEDAVNQCEPTSYPATEWFMQESRLTITTCGFTVLMSDVVDASLTPPAPSDEPPDGYPEVVEVDLTVIDEDASGTQADSVETVVTAADQPPVYS